MRRVRDATQEEVRLASQYRDDARVIGELFTLFPRAELWELTRSDIGRVLVTVHEPVRDSKGCLQDLFPNWTRWIAEPSSEPQSDKSIYQGFVDALRNGRAIPTPILQGMWEIHDGRHRFFAMYEVLGQREKDSTMRAYWVHNWAEGILAHIG